METDGKNNCCIPPTLEGWVYIVPTHGPLDGPLYTWAQYTPTHMFKQVIMKSLRVWVIKCSISVFTITNNKSRPKIRYYYGNKMPLLIIHCTSLGMVDFSRPNELFLA